MHGSWNRGQRTGYKVVRLLFNGAKPTGEYEDFMTGFVISDKEVWERPVGLAVAKDARCVRVFGIGTKARHVIRIDIDGRSCDAVGEWHDHGQPPDF